MENPIGEITHFYNRISVAVLSLTDTLDVGDKIHIVGHTTDFAQQVNSMEIEHEKVLSGGPGDDVALKVVEHVRNGDKIYKISDES